MPTWKQILDEVKEAGSAYDVVRRRHLKRLSQKTGRNTIIYYSGWLQKGDIFAGRSGLSIDDNDKNGFMATVHKLDRAKGLDLILHTPGGDLAAAESIVDYLHRMFGTNIRAIVPQLAMSAGTMIACAGKEVVMGKHSNLGPIDPQIGGISAQALIETWNRAHAEILRNPAAVNVWLPVLQKYHPGLVQQCEQAVKWSEQIVCKWLQGGMLANEADPAAAAKAAVDKLSSHVGTLSHARHLHRDEIRDMGLKVVELEADQGLQDAVLTVHHTCIQTLTASGAYKIIENQRGAAFIQTIQHVVVPR